MAQGLRFALQWYIIRCGSNRNFFGPTACISRRRNSVSVAVIVMENSRRISAVLVRLPSTMKGLRMSCYVNEGQSSCVHISGSVCSAVLVTRTSNETQRLEPSSRLNMRVTVSLSISIHCVKTVR